MDFRLKTLLPDYEKAFLTCNLQKEKESEVQQVVERMKDLRQHYETVEQATGIPFRGGLQQFFTTVSGTSANLTYL